jgi:hypothetical protein
VLDALASERIYSEESITTLGEQMGDELNDALKSKYVAVGDRVAILAAANGRLRITGECTTAHACVVSHVVACWLAHIVAIALFFHL